MPFDRFPSDRPLVGFGKKKRREEVGMGGME